MELNTLVYRKCVKCKVEKIANHDNFYKDKNRSLGLMYRCKDCDKNRKDKRVWSERKANLSEEQKLAMKIAKKKYSKTLVGKSIHLLKAYQNNDMIKNRECSLNKYDIFNILNTPCTYCQFPSTGFDRVDNSIGHILSNCVPCCKECNVARMNNFTHKEMFLIGKVIGEIKSKRIKDKDGYVIL